MARQGSSAKVTIAPAYRHTGGEWLRVSVAPYFVFVIQCPTRDSSIHGAIALACSFGAAVNLGSAGEQRVVIAPSFAIPDEFVALCTEYSRLQKRVNIQVDADSRSWRPPDQVGDRDPILLLSGGKDSAYALRQWVTRKGCENLRCLYVRGSGANIEFLDEESSARKLARESKRQLIVQEAHAASYTSLGLNVRLRSIWREFLLIAMGRSLSDRVITGITYEPLLHEVGRDLAQVDGAFVNFAISWIGLEYMRTVLGCEIELTEAEMEIYRRCTEMEESRSCLNPLGKCDTDADWNRACAKCKTFYVYKLLLAGMKLGKRELGFVRSNHWMGEYAIRAEIMAREHEGV